MQGPERRTPRRGAGVAAVEAYLRVGSNLGRREQHLARAVLKLRSPGEVAEVSGLYESVPVGVTDQPFFLNRAGGRLSSAMVPDFYTLGPHH